MKIFTLISPLSILIFFSFVTNIKCINSCPPKEDIYPCTCRHPAYYHSIICDGIQSDQELSRVFRNMRWYPPASFKLYNSTIKYLPKDIFNGTRILQIDLENNVFNQLFEDVPQDPGVKLFNLRKVRVLGRVNWKPFTAFQKLTELNLQSSPIRGLANFKQYAPKSLTTVEFTSCQIRKIQNDDFQDLMELEDITIDHDTIKKLKRSMFPKPSKMKTMRFYDNQISSIPEDLFEDMSVLQTINFVDNQLVTLPEVLRTMDRSFRMYFQGNPIQCDCSLKWIPLKKPEVIGGTCETPRILKGKYLENLTIEDFRYC